MNQKKARNIKKKTKVFEKTANEKSKQLLQTKQNEKREEEKRKEKKKKGGNKCKQRESQKNAQTKLHLKQNTKTELNVRVQGSKAKPPPRRRARTHHDKTQ